MPCLPEVPGNLFLAYRLLDRLTATWPKEQNGCTGQDAHFGRDGVQMSAQRSSTARLKSLLLPAGTSLAAKLISDFFRAGFEGKRPGKANTR
jgi:hypothetical protein